MSSLVENQGVAPDINRDDQETLLEEAESYLRDSVAPLASAMDSDSEILRDALKGMGDRSLLALRVPKSWGGAGVSEETYRRFQQLVPRYSGALAFLQTQHQGAAEILTNSDNEVLKAAVSSLYGQGSGVSRCRLLPAATKG
jgi:alkylation response protein AidB-like acyl-CoA dehydrogenase